MTPILTPKDKAKVTLAISSFLKAKAAMDEAKRALDEAKATLLATLDGDDKAKWVTDEHEYALSATYGKTRSSLNADLIEKVLGVKVTEACYVKSAPWDEVRVKVIF